MHGQQAGTDQGEAVLAQALAAYRAALGPRLIAAYALGSLAHGGFSPLVSDVDVGLILADPFRMKDRITVRTVGNAVRAGGSVLHERLSVFWGTPSTLQGWSSRGRFPPLDRLDLLEHGRLLAGTEARHGVARPGRDELLVAGAEFALGYLGGAPGLPERLRGWPMRGGGRGEDPVAEIRAPSLLVSRGPRRRRRVAAPAEAPRPAGAPARRRHPPPPAPRRARPAAATQARRRPRRPGTAAFRRSSTCS